MVIHGLVEGEVEVEDALLDVLGEVHLLPAWMMCYLYSETMTASPFLTAMTSVSLRCSSFLLRGLLRMITDILGCSSALISMCSNDNLSNRSMHIM